ncbi:MAG: YigZ family protein [Bacteroidetes bacterium]|nr:YigZ family protein [Bacteroidota bacterium]
MQSSPTTYRSISQSTTSEFKDRGSKFIAYTFPIQTLEDIKKELNTLKELHPKAVHHCYAWRIGIDGNSFRANDDGEPSGSAGKPILGQIDSTQITNVLVVVVRYFGGTLLGVPGLINAYKTVTHDALQQSLIIEKNIEMNFKLQFPYTLMNEVMRIIKMHHINLIKSELTLFCEYHIGIPIVELEIANTKFEQLHELEISKIEITK